MCLPMNKQLKERMSNTPCVLRTMCFTYSLTRTGFLTSRQTVCLICVLCQSLIEFCRTLFYVMCGT